MTTTNINIRISQSRPRTRTPRRHVSIPHTDLWTQEWWEAQTDPSASVRQLISDDVALFGMTDVLSRISAPAVAVQAAQTAPVAPAAPAVGVPDAEVVALRDEFAKFRDLMAPLMPFLDAVAAEHKKV